MTEEHGFETLSDSKRPLPKFSAYNYNILGTEEERVG